MRILFDYGTPSGLAGSLRRNISERTCQREGRERSGREFRTRAETRGAARARKLIDAGQRREDVAVLLNLDCTTLYRALA